MSTGSTQVGIDSTFGAVFIGSSIAMGLWGAVTVQTYYYFNEYPNDPWRLKILVTLVWIFDTIHQAFITHATYLYLVSNYGNPLFLNVLVRTLVDMVLVSGLACLLVEAFLLYRVWHLSEKNTTLTGILTALAISQFVTNTWYYVLASRFTSFGQLPTITWLSKTVNSLSAATDVSIALTLIFLLHRSRTGVRRSETMINRLIIFTVNTGALTSIVALLTVLTVSLYPDQLIYVAFYVCISRMYTNTLLATLNIRKRTRNVLLASVHHGSSNVYISDDRTNASGHERMMNKSRNGRAAAIRVETETVHDNIDLEDLKHGRAQVGDQSEHGHSYDKDDLDRV